MIVDSGGWDEREGCGPRTAYECAFAIQAPKGKFDYAIQAPNGNFVYVRDAGAYASR